MSSQLVLAILGSAGLFTVLGAIVQGIFSKKKLGADATEIITRAAASAVERSENEIKRLTGEVNELREEQASWSALVDRWARVLQLHAAWDHMAIETLRRCGHADLPPVPPLYPPDTTPGDLSR